MTSEELVPIDKVLDDMYNDYGGLVQSAARDYYYQHYASPEEQAAMDREDKNALRISIAFWAIVIVGIIFGIISQL